MKKLITILITALVLFLIICRASYAQTIPVNIIGKVVTLSWDPVTKNTDGSTLTNLGGYKIYYGGTSNVYTLIRDVGNVTTYKMTFSDYTLEYFVVKAYTTAGLISGPSNEVAAQLSAPSTPLNPGNLAIGN